MATEVQTQTGQCATHGTVQATREHPQDGIPVHRLRLLAVQGQAQAVSLPGMRRGGRGRLSRTQPTSGAPMHVRPGTAASPQ